VIPSLSVQAAEPIFVVDIIIQSAANLEGYAKIA